MHENGKPLLYYDISELGWTMYLAAHLKYLAGQKRPAAIAVQDAKRVFYRDCALEILPIPEEWVRKYGKYPSDGNHLYNPLTRRRIKSQQLLSHPFTKAYPQYQVVTRYSRFQDQRIFEAYTHDPAMEDLSDELFGDRRVLLVFPRHRSGKFRGRNIPRKQWIRIIRSLCDRYPDFTIAAFGSSGGAYTGLQPEREHFIDLVGYDDNRTLDLMVSLCNTRRAVAAVGNQSGTVKITLLCGTPTFIFGHERKRHMVDENWSGTVAGFYQVDSFFGFRLRYDRKAYLSGYRIREPGKMIGEILSFIDKAECKNQ